MSESPRKRVLVIGLGNRLRRDDAVGPLVADRLKGRGFEVVEHSGDGAALIDRWQGAQTVVVIDAASSGAQPGVIHRFDAAKASLPREVFHVSSHLFGLAEAVEMARALGRLPSRLVVYGIEGASFGHSEGLSPAVERAAREVARRILEELDSDEPRRRAG